MHKSATKCNETIGKWCKNKHGASKIIDTLETYQCTMKTFLWQSLATAPAPPGFANPMKEASLLSLIHITRGANHNEAAWVLDGT
jgi:hypothetical protein